MDQGSGQPDSGLAANPLLASLERDSGGRALILAILTAANAMIAMMGMSGVRSMGWNLPSSNPGYEQPERSPRAAPRAAWRAPRRVPGSR